jgi:hypothetical protein
MRCKKHTLFVLANTEGMIVISLQVDDDLEAGAQQEEYTVYVPGKLSACVFLLSSSAMINSHLPSLCF